jgi:hypothetical protein
MAARTEWPASAEELAWVQEELARASPPDWTPPAGRLAAGGYYACFARGVGGQGAGPATPAWPARP